MATTRTSQQHLVTRAALFDELGKIAEAQPDKTNRAKLKSWLKSTAIIAAGTGAGTAAFMVADRIIGDKLGPTWKNTSPRTKMLVVAPLLGLAGLGSQVLMKARPKDAE